MKTPYHDGSSFRFWASGVKQKLEQVQNFEINKLTDIITAGSTICSAGSCFAQHIGKHLIDRDYKFLVSTLSGDRTESFGLGNIYTTRQMKQWIEFFLGTREWSDKTFFEDNKNLFHDYLLPHLPSVSSEAQLLDRRVKVGDEFISHISVADVFIFTCGLTEQWVTRCDETLTICPGTVVGKYDPEQHYFINLDFSDILHDLSKIEEYILKLNPGINFIYTVSPVPLTATAEEEHVLVSTCFSKSKLRAAVGEHVRKSKKSEYFPSYELITHSDLGDWRFESNLRSVSSNGVRYVMRHGFDEAMEKADHQNKFDAFFDNIDLYCEEEKLEALNKIRSSSANHSDIFLIGDSQMGKLGRAFEQIGVSCSGGHIMSGSAWAMTNFEPDNERIFIPKESPEYVEIWDQTLKKLEQKRSKTVIFSNIGFQLHRNIPYALSHNSGEFVLSMSEIADYIEKTQAKNFEILFRLSNYGEIVIVEDPNIVSLLEAPLSEWSEQNKTLFRQIKQNFSTYCSCIEEITSALNFKYISVFSSVVTEIIKETDDFENVMGPDMVHASKLYYQKLARLLAEEYQLEAFEPSM